jgi:hypothetical protein
MSSNATEVMVALFLGGLLLLTFWRQVLALLAAGMVFLVLFGAVEMVTTLRQ